MKRAFVRSLIGTLILLSAFCFSVSSAAVVELDLVTDPMYGPRENCYIYEEGNSDPVGYEDPSISVTLITGRFMDTNWLAARVKLSSPTQFRTAMAAKFGSKNTVVGSTIAKKNAAVFAINGDFFSARDDVGSVIRAGKTYRNRCKGNMDVLLVDYQGDLHILREATAQDMEYWEGHIMHSFTFGPALVVDGVPLGRSELRDHNNGTVKHTQRMAICQSGPLEYICVCCEGPEDPGSEGLYLWDFVTLIHTEFPEATQAYNLDGGSSSTMIFRVGDNPWAKVNAPLNPKKRLLGDIIYFASAWDGEEGFLVEDED